LFERPARAFSSGCIRLERPRELAVLLLNDPVEWDRARLDAAIADGAIRTVMLKRPIPVLLLYFTAEADELGTPSFRPDLYGHDKAVLAGLAEQFRFSAIATGAPR
jgi:murein L,D-transpeptidase YcbB/YkuD